MYIFNKINFLKYLQNLFNIFKLNKLKNIILRKKLMNKNYYQDIIR